MSEAIQFQTNWVQALANTYDACERQPGLIGRIDIRQVVKDDKVYEFAQRPLTPLYHDLRLADLACEIKKNGDFVKIYKLTESKDRITIIPVTDKSMARTACPYPHPLAEVVNIITGGSEVQMPDGAKDSDQLPDNASDYLKQLDGWVTSDDFVQSPEWEKAGVLAVYRYVKQGRLLSDLNDVFPEPKDFQAMKACLVKWIVVDLDEDEGNTDLSQNHNTWRIYQRHFRALQDANPNTERGFCYATGVYGPVMQMAPKGLVKPGSRGKLFPVCATNMNPGTGVLTFRGPFFDAPNDACTINRDVSEKAHSMFRWLFDRQSWTMNPKSLFPRVIVWDPSHPEHTINVNTLFGGDPVSEFDPDKFVVDETTGEVIGRRDEKGEVTRVEMLRMASDGYVVDGLMDSVKNLVIMTVDASDDDAARIAVTGFTSMTADEYVKRLIYWHETTKHGYFQKGLTCREIVSLIVDVKGKQEDYFKKYYTKFIVKSINTGHPLPEDIIRLAFHKVINTCSYAKEKGEDDEAVARRHGRNLEAVCALIRKRTIDYNDGGCPNYMNTLDENYTGRDYLYGRALACFDTLERRALYAKNRTRPTNAWLLMPRFFQQPAFTTSQLMDKVNPYLATDERWKKSQYVMRVLNSVMAGIAEQTTPGVADDAPLGYEALLGYHWQMNAFNNFSKKEDAEEDEGDDGDDAESAD